MFLSSKRVHKGLQQLNQDGIDDKDRVLAGAEFPTQYVGSIEVSGFSGTGSGKTKTAVENVFQRSKQGKKAKRMIMTVSYQTLSVKTYEGKLVASFPISKVTFCNVDSKYEKAFVFVARDDPDSPFKAYVFMCETKAKAMELFKLVSLAFSVNYELYQASLVRQANLKADARHGITPCNGKMPLESENRMRFQNHDTAGTIVFDQSAFQISSDEVSLSAVPKRFTEDVTRARSHTDPQAYPDYNQNSIASKNDDDFEAEFTQLAKSRSNTASNVHQVSSQPWGLQFG
ncbi:low density lipoprotein receptor adapter protein 1 [Nematostella vectensis]|uniref:low density lipoprotein receptor adapter protein 1 n=1 Tax=Nematostella vectensis TaxID=45351 RepID=UPI0020775C42|nr:low density lipoprotein receptor adapter protein 1 [Nematostella vectensis]